MNAFQSIGPTFGWTIIMWVLVVLLVPAIVAALWWWVNRNDSWSDADIGFWVFGGLWVLVAFGALATWLIIPDANRDNYAVSGTVTDVSNTFTTGSGNVTSGYAFHLNTVNGTLWSTDDRMIAMKGKTIDLICTLEWVPNAGDYYNCRPAVNLP